MREGERKKQQQCKQESRKICTMFKQRYFTYKVKDIVKKLMELIEEMRW